MDDTPVMARGLIVNSHAVTRYKERSGDNAASTKAIVDKIKKLVKENPAVSGVEDTSYVRVTGSGNNPIWIVIQGRIVRTVLTHEQYLAKIEGRRVP